MGIFMLLAISIFVISIALGVGVFFYEKIIESSIESKAESLDRAQAAFEPGLIRELSRLSARIDSSKDLLNSHTALSAFFEHLEKVTLQTVRFSNLSISEEDGKTALSMNGEAESFSSIALQDQRFGDSDIIVEPIFSNLSLDASGNVTFSFFASIDTSRIAYEETLSQRGQ